MLFTISFFIALGILISGAILSFFLFKYKKVKVGYNSFHVIAVAVFSSAVVLFFPIYYKIFSEDRSHIIKPFLLSVHNAIRLFIVDGEFSIITDNISSDLVIYEFYSFLAALLFVVAPILTFGAVVSIFKNIFAYQKLLLNRNSETFVFSELNEKSISLAKSLSLNNKKRLIVFTDVFPQNEEENYELVFSAKKMGAICLKKDIADINFKIHNSKKSLSYFIIGSNDIENIKQSLKIIDNYKHSEKVSLYLFSNTAESELFVSSLEKDKMKVQRINNSQSLIFRTLYDSGEKIFDGALGDNDNERIISAVVVGMGSYGTEMVKALSWFCQMDNYRVYINAFDKDILASSKFRSSCPELMDEEYNGNFESLEDAQYRISINSGIDVLSYDFDKKLALMNDTTYVLVSLGDDDLNIRTSLKIRRIFESKGIHPQIQTIIFSELECKEFEKITNFKGQKIDIEFIGDLENSYSEEVILHSDIEKEALNRHLKWGNENDFWRYEYHYRSSVASALHYKMKMYCKIPGVDKTPNNRTEEEKQNLRMLEHRRWNAYMRSEGYSYAPVRNDLAKQHNCLVPFNQLSEADKMKDDD